MNRRRVWSIITLLSLLVTLSTHVGISADEKEKSPEKPEAGPKLAFRVAKVLTMDQENRVINNATVLVDSGKIVAIGKTKDLETPDGYTEIDKTELWLVPGLIDCHNHSAGSLRDLNDMVYLSNPGLRTLECLEPGNERNKRALAGGVTTVLTIPGSGTNLSGFGTITKLAGETPDDMVVKAPGSLKIAQAGNPERYWYGVGRSFMNYNTRQTLEKARRYHLEWKKYEEAKAAGEDAKKPDHNPFFHDFRGLFEREFIVSVHTQMYQVVMTTVLMLAKRFNLRTVLDHSTFDGWKVAPLVLKDPSIITINGPRQFHFDRTQRKMMGNAARWWQAGIRKLGVNTDSPVVPQESLSFQAAMACWYGWKPYEALRGITRVPAEALMLDDELGSIEPGKDAEFGLWTGDPIDPRSSCELTVVRGRIVYDATKGRRY